MSPFVPRLLTATLLMLVCNPAGAENWSRFRGPNGTGISNEKGIPATWTSEDYAWNIEIPGEGHAAPIIWDDTLFITTAIDGGTVRQLHCLDAATGTEKWVRSMGFSTHHKHGKNSYASSTPTTDGERVYVVFSDDEQQTISAFDFDGELVWKRLLGPYKSQHAQGISPILFEDLVILANDQDGPSSILAFHRETGETVWSTLRPSREASYATPMIIERQEGRPELILVSGVTGISSVDPFSGTVHWESGALPLRTVASPVFAGGLLFASCGQAGQGKLLVAVDPAAPADGDRVKYSLDRILPYVPTPVAYDGHLYLWGDKGIVSCVKPETGDYVWTERVGGNFSGSPICVDGKLYCVDEEGQVTVVAASPTYKLYGKTSLGDPSHSTPAAANGRLYLRTFHRLMCLDGAQAGAAGK